MLMEVLLIGAERIYTIILLIAFIVISRLYGAEVKKSVDMITRGIVRLEQRGEIVNVLVNVMKKKRYMLYQTYSYIVIFLFSRMSVTVMAYLMTEFDSLVFYESIQLFMIVVLIYLFRCRKAVQISLVTLPGGTLALSSRDTVIVPAAPKSLDIEMVICILFRVPYPKPLNEKNSI
jgi:hypothetical protein